MIQRIDDDFLVRTIGINSKHFTSNHLKWDKRFLKLAQFIASWSKDPSTQVGAVIVDSSGKIIARAHNQVESKDTQTAHAELRALAKAGKKMGDWRLLDCWLYVTLEPCAMCMQAIKLHRLAGVVYGADSPLFGYQLDKNQIDSVYKYDALKVIAPTSSIQGPFDNCPMHRFAGMLFCKRAVASPSEVMY